MLTYPLLATTGRSLFLSPGSLDHTLITPPIVPCDSIRTVHVFAPDSRSPSLFSTLFLHDSGPWLLYTLIVLLCRTICRRIYMIVILSSRSWPMHVITHHIFCALSGHVKFDRGRKRYLIFALFRHEKSDVSKT